MLNVWISIVKTPGGRMDSFELEIEHDYLEHPAFVDVSPLDMSFPTRHLGQHLHC